MNTLKYYYNNIIKNKDEWSYYMYPPCLSVDTLRSNNESLKFIEEYFKRGGKERVFDNIDIRRNKKEIEERATHIISTYILGIIIAKCFNRDLKTRDCNNINFKYLWFLACLYHDIGYVYENMKNCKYLKAIQTDGLDAMQYVCEIKYLHDREFITYKKEYINTYLTNRAICSNGEMGKIDHGIAGGLLLYDRLMKNFDQAWVIAYNCDCSISRESFEYNGLHFSNTHYKYYAEAADAIIAHNIWMNTLKEYLQKEGKSYFEVNRIEKNNKILFILSLADTLEPIKRKGIMALDEICFEEIKNGFTLSMPVDVYSTIYGNISDLKTWVDVEIIEERNQGRFSIKLK